MLSLPRGKRILVVDDEPDTCEMIADELAGCEVGIARSYEEGRAKLAAGGWDLVILDIMGVDGFRLLEEFGGKAPTIMLTAHALSPADLERARAGRAVLYLPKAEIGFIEEFAARALSSAEPLWPWAFRRVDYRAWFGPDWSPPPDAAGEAPAGG
jgi:CheY-like chemotaxis protein